MALPFEAPHSTTAELTLLGCGERICSPGHTAGPVVWEPYLLLYCTDGHGVCHANGISHALGAQEGILILPGEATLCQADLETPWHYLWLAFRGTQAQNCLAHCGLSAQQRTFCCTETAALQSCIRRMTEHRHLRYSDEFYEKALLYQYFALLAEAADLAYQPDSTTSRRIDKAVEYLRNNYQHPVTIAELADYICLNRSYLTTLFQRELHLSPRDCLTRLRIQRAKELLETSALPVAQVAHSCGYPDPLAFSRAFRRLEGCSPSDYRTQHSVTANCRN